MRKTILEFKKQTVKEKHDRLQHKIKTLAVEINNKRREKIQHERETEEEREQAGRQCEALKGEIIDEMEQFNDRVSSTHNSIVAATGQCGLSSAGVHRAPRRHRAQGGELHARFDKICSETKTHVDPSADPALKGKHPLEGLVPLLLKSEEENYLVFRTINELNQELETLELEKVSLEDDMEQRALANEDRLHQEENMKKELGAQLATSEATEKTHEDQHRANEQSLISASEAVTTIFHKLGCGEIPSGEALPQLDASLSAPFDDATDESPDDAAFAAPIDPSKLLNSQTCGDAWPRRGGADAGGLAGFAAVATSLATFVGLPTRSWKTCDASVARARVARRRRATPGDTARFPLTATENDSGGPYLCLTSACGSSLLMALQ
ncbi:hypothetical protein SO694_00002862 [Aureococcus anophagefferens]|uniref:ODAD1 central coiled coil region domain-containing protein n=1 Tax=Aureococcus anophagefferens TaxID=44056 RepID=A0ABR1GDN8_AURAN